MKSMKCKNENCNNEIYYINRYECYKCGCGKVYNGAGRELAPVSSWREEFDKEEECR